MQEKQMLADQIEYDKQQMARLLAEQRAEDAQKNAHKGPEKHNLMQKAGKGTSCAKKTL